MLVSSESRSVLPLATGRRKPARHAARGDHSTAGTRHDLPDAVRRDCAAWRAVRRPRLRGRSTPRRARRHRSTPPPVRDRRRAPSLATFVPARRGDLARGRRRRGSTGRRGSPAPSRRSAPRAPRRWPPSGRWRLVTSIHSPSLTPVWTSVRTAWPSSYVQQKVFSPL